MTRKLTKEEVLAKIPQGLSLVDSYEKCGQKCKFKCYCGNIFATYPEKVFNGNTRSCGCIKRTGTKNISGSYFSKIKARAERVK